MLRTNPQTLPQALALAAETSPEVGISILDGRGQNPARRTFPELRSVGLDLAARMAGMGIGPGRPVLLCLPTSWAFLDAWMGAIHAGAWPVSVSPPGGFGSAAHQLARIEELLEQLDTEWLICGESLIRNAREAGNKRLLECAVTPEQLAAGAPLSGFCAPESAPADIAFLQLTSGSTGRSRAVMISHRAALHNPRAISAALGAPRGETAETRFDDIVCWLPLNHDMGLVGCLLSSLVWCKQLWLMSPRSFLGRPQTWLQQIGSHGRTISPAPNFAYGTCVERVTPDQLEGLDLSRWEAALVGAEMVRLGTMRAFAERFEELGFSADRIVPCYGLAEGTLAVTIDQRGLGPRAREQTNGEVGLSEIVSVGAPVSGAQLEIRTPDGAARPEGQVGEVCTFGPSVFEGYYRDEAASAQCLRAGWLHTGDLGYMHDGELWITGRVKDVLIVRGHNLMPHELEWVAESVTGGGGSRRTGAFSVHSENEGELPVIAVEIESEDPIELDGLERETRVRVGRALSLQLADVVFVRRGKLPKTTSGKVQRRELRRRYLAGELERLR